MPIFVGSSFPSNVFTATSTASSSATMWWTSGTSAATTSVWYGATMVPFSTAQEALAMRQQAFLQQQLLNQQRSPFMQPQGLGQIGQYHNMASPAMTPAAHERIERERAIAIRQEAHARAKTLLVSFLSAEQRQQFELGEGIIVVGKSGTRYRIRQGHVGNVDVLRKGDNYVVQSLCFHPSNDNELPVYDTMLAQMLHLQHDDAAARRIANVHHRY